MGSEKEAVVPCKRTGTHSHLPVTESQVLAPAGLDKHHLGTEEQLLHDVCEEPCIHLWVGEALGQPTAVLNQLVATGSAVPMQIQDGDAQGGAGGLSRSEFMDQVLLVVEIILPITQSLEKPGGRSQNCTDKQKWN